MGMDVYGTAPTSDEGKYFRANVWSWRPIHHLCETVLKRRLEGWGFNDGAGFDTQRECDDLAAKLASYLEQFPGEEISIESDMRVDNRGHLTHGTGGESAYKTTHKHVIQFIIFLRNCGGFKIC